MRVLVLVLSLLVAGCGLLPGASTAPSLDPRALARGTVTALASAWNISADLCLGVEDTGKFAPGTCAKALLPARDGLLAAASAVDTWDAASQKNLPCLVLSVMNDVAAAEKLVQDAGVKVPPAVDDAIHLASFLAPTCQPATVAYNYR